MLKPEFELLALQTVILCLGRGQPLSDALTGVLVNLIAVLLTVPRPTQERTEYGQCELGSRRAGACNIINQLTHPVTRDLVKRQLKQRA